MRTRAKAGAVDTALIAAAFAFEEPDVQTLLDAPTADLVKEFLETLSVKAKEFDTAKADKLRSDVELENTVRSGESRVKGLKATVNKGLQEIEQLRKQLDEQENDRASLQTELDSCKAASTDADSEVEALRTRVNTLEASNRDTLSVLESKSASHDKLADELATQHQKTIALRRDISALEDKNQTLENAASSARFKEQSLQQEVDLLKRNNEWHESELKTKASEHTKFRKEKNARITELQRTNQDAETQIEALKRTEATLRQRLEELGQKADGAFAKIQQMQEAASKAEESFRVELDSARRLADLQKQSADTARARLQDLQNSIDQINENAADEVGQLQAEIETERSDKEAAERKLAELELAVERLQAAASNLPSNGSAPGTPQRGTNGLTVATPARDTSPAIFTPARMKGNMSFTQLYSQYSTMKSELEVERRRNRLLTNELDEMIRDLEARGPEQEELRQEKERVDAEIIEMSSILDQATVERDEARREARNLSSQIEGLGREGDILRQQLRDLSAQIKIILVEMQARDQGLEALDVAGQVQLQMLASGELDDQSAADETSAGALISQRLLLFKNVSELQDQNVQLLKLNRGLADRMEGDAAKAREAEQANAIQELDELRDRVQRHQDEIRSMTTQTESIMRERDMFRRMLSHRGQLPQGVDVQSMFGQSVDGRVTPSTPPHGGASRNVEQTPQSKELADYGKLLKEMQSHFDAYRQEAATDHSTLKQQVDHLAREKGELQGEVARTGGQLTLAHERYEMLQANYGMLKGENAELQKRSQSLAESAAKQDLRIQHVVEELVETRTLADSMRTDTANLKAERELWKKIEARLTEDNRGLMDERGRLNKMMADLQNLQNEREHADSESRRRLQSRADLLETELEAAKKKLENEVEDAKKAALRREYDQDQSRTRIDDLVKSLSNVREELVAAKTARDQLQARVDEMKIELRAAEERAHALQPRPTPRAEQAPADGDAESAPDDSLSREQELQLEITELKRELDLARGELESAKAQVEQYKAISQASEEELQSLNDTNDQYREEMDRIIAEKDSKIKDQEGRLEELGTELSTTNTELSSLRTQHEESAIHLEEQKRLLESEIARLRDESERYAETAKLHQEDLKAQAEIAQQAQQSYENELVKHADAAKNLQNVRADYHQLRTEVAAIKAEAEASKATLTQSEESWTEVRDRYERELTEVRLGREDLKSQNKLLHDQLESVSTQISTLQQKKLISEDDDPDAPSGSEFENLQEVIKYLRREKEIVDVQYELSVQESKRLRQQLDYAQSQLDETRQKLGEERQEQVDRDASAVSHNKLMQTINELNLFRESSATLRHETRQAQAQLGEKAKELESLTAQIEPLQTRIREVENELETKEGEMKLLQDDRDRWRDRTQNIISKYDRVDPAEMESLRTQITDLQTARDQLLTEKQQLQDTVDAHPEEMRLAKEEAGKTWQEQKAKFIEQAKARSREQSAKIRELEKDLGGIRDERDRLSGELMLVREQLDAAQTARDEAIAQADAAAQQVQQQEESEEGQVEEGQPTMSENDSAAAALLEQAEARASEEAAKAATRASEIESLQSRVNELEGQVDELQQQLNSTAAELTQIQDQSLPVPGSDNIEHLEKLREDLATAQQEVETLRAAAANANPDQPVAVAATASGEEKPLSEQVAEQVAQLRIELESQHNLSKQQLEADFNNRTNLMKQKLNQKLREDREKFKEEGRQEALIKHSEELQALQNDHQAAIERLKEEHRLEIERLTKEGQAAVTKAQAKEQPTTAAPQPAPTDTAEATSKPSEMTVIDPAEMEFTDDQARTLVAKNTIIRGIVSRNIQNKVGEQTAKLKQEHEKISQDKAEEAKKEREQAVTKAVNMETMKQKAKLGMAEGQARTAKAKLDVVEKAAIETPQRAVVEVWEMAKVTKAAPAAPATPAPAPKPTQVSVPGASSPMKPTVNGPQSPSIQPPQNMATPAPPQEDRMQARMQKFGAPSASIPQATPPQAGSFGQPSFAPNQQATASPAQGLAAPQTTSVAHNTQLPNAAAGMTTQAQTSTGMAQPPQQASAAPARQVSGQQVGMAPGALRSVQGGTGIPQIPRGGASMLPRGGATFRGRGGLPQAGLQHSLPGAPQQPQQGGQGISVQGAAGQAHRGGGVQSGLPRGGARGRGGGGRGGQGGGSPMNPVAQQFVPKPGGPPQGNKRPHEGGEEGAGKRMRGGAGGT
ncbi:hypothetical protein MBLNU459_g1079t1 [Dothideomycetes sp. NU459]